MKKNIWNDSWCLNSNRHRSLQSNASISYILSLSMTWHTNCKVPFLLTKSFKIIWNLSSFNIKNESFRNLNHLNLKWFHGSCPSNWGKEQNKIHTKIELTMKLNGASALGLEAFQSQWKTQKKKFIGKRFHFKTQTTLVRSPIHPYKSHFPCLSFVFNLLTKSTRVI